MQGCLLAIHCVAACAQRQSLHVTSSSNASETEIGNTIAEKASGDPTFIEDDEPAETQAQCYSGFLGSCGVCDMEGSCICAKRRNGHTDYVPMDRRRWGQRILVCPNHDIASYVMLAILAALALEAILRTLHTIHFQHGVLKEKGLLWRHHLPLLSCAAAVLSISSLLAIVTMKFISPTHLIAVDISPSLLHAARSVFVFAEVECDYVHFFTVTVKAQRASIGRQRVQDAVLERVRAIPKQVFIASAASAIPFIGAIFTSLGVITTTEGHLTLMLVAVTVESGCATYFVLLKQRVARKLAESFHKCIVAVNASLVVASGGANRMDVNTESCRQNLGSGQGVNAQQHRSLLVEESQLDDALKSLNTHQRQQKIALVSTALFTLPFLCIPPLWSRMTYCWLFQSILVVIAQRQYTLVYSRARYHKAVRRVQRV